MDTKEDAKRRTRRQHDEQLKRQVIEECSAPGASVAKVAMDHGLNANLVHKWRRRAARPSAETSEAFVAVTLPSAVVDEPAQCIELELQRGALSVRVRWPMAGAASCAAWLRELLR